MKEVIYECGSVRVQGAFKLDDTHMVALHRHDVMPHRCCSHLAL